MQPAHTVQLQPWQSASVGERIAIQMTLMALWPLKDDARMTVLLSLMADQVAAMTESDDQIDALLDVLRMQLRMSRALS